jgi:hypothetical protein
MNLEYRGQAVTIRLFPSASGEWHWAFWMSGVDYYEDSDQPFGTGRAALASAREAAVRHLDALDVREAS